MNNESDIFFFKGEQNILEKNNDSDPIEHIQETFRKGLDTKNLSFLIGSGCSSFKDGNKKELGIPTMIPLAKEFFESELSEDDKTWLKDNIKLDVNDDQFQKNIEFFLGSLYSLEFFYRSINQKKDGGEEDSEEEEEEEEDDDDINKKLEKIQDIIQKAKKFLIKRYLNEENKQEGKDIPLLELYQKFYRKLLIRNTNLPKINIFTTNYDLYSEIALDRLGIHYVNGFSGGIKKYFNPTIFNYALAEKMDLSQEKWSVIDNFIYLYKIHGSINWIMDDEESKLFKVREVQETSAENLQKMGTVMIHPTPQKQNASLGSPYSDLFREFQNKLMQKNNVLVTIGYSFSDEHINNLIYQAFTIPSFRLIVLGNYSSNEELKKLKSLDDPRVWIIGGNHEGKKLHYFKGFIDEVLPDFSNEEIDDKIENAIKTLFKRNE